MEYEFTPIALFTSDTGVSFAVSPYVIWRDSSAFKRLQGQVVLDQTFDGFRVQSLLWGHTPESVYPTLRHYWEMAKDAPKKGEPIDPKSFRGVKGMRWWDVDLRPHGGNHTVRLLDKTIRKIFAREEAAYALAAWQEPKDSWNVGFYRIVVSDKNGVLVGACCAVPYPNWE